MRLSLWGRRRPRIDAIQGLERQALALRGEDPDRALDMFKTVLAQSPASLVSLRAAGRLLMKARRLEEAKPYWERLARAAPEDPEPHVQLGRIHRRGGRPEAAQAEADAALRLAPHHAAAHDLKLRLGQAVAPLPPPRQPWWRLLLGRPASAPSPAAPVPAGPDALMARARACAADGDSLGFVRVMESLLVTVGPSRKIVELAVANQTLIRRAASGRLRTLLDLALAADSGGGVDEVEAELARRARRKVSAPRSRRKLVADARAQIEDGDVAGFLRTLRTALAVDGPSPELAALVGEHAAVVRRTGEPRLLALVEHTPGAGEEQPASADSLIGEAGLLMRDGDVGGFLRVLRTSLALDGPSPALMSLVQQHAEAVRASGDARLGALLDFNAARGAGGPADLAATERALEARRRGRRAAESPMIAGARRRLAEGDLAGFLKLLEDSLTADGPTPALAELTRDNAGVVRRLGARPLQALLADGFAFARAPDPLVDQWVSAIQAALTENDLPGAAEALESLSGQGSQVSRETLGAQAESVLLALKSGRDTLATSALAELEERLVKVYAHEPWVIQALARQRELGGDPAGALDCYRTFDDNAAGAGPALLHAATLAAGAGQADEAWDFARRASRAAPDDRRLIGTLSDLLVRHGQQAHALDLWRGIDDARAPRLWARLGLVRTLEAVGERAAVASETLATLRAMLPLADQGAAEKNLLVDIIRHLVQSQARARDAGGLDEIATLLLDHEPSSPLRQWVLASIELARPNVEKALAHLDRGLEIGPASDEVSLDLHAEKALALQRYHRFGEAWSQWQAANQEKVRVNGHYARRRDFVRQVIDLCAGAPEPVLYPECLFDILFKDIERAQPSYAANPGHLVMVSGSLGQGGGERQTITVVRRMIGDERLAKLSLLVRSTHMREHDDFFLSRLSELPVDLTVYGADWQTRTDVAALLPEFADRPRVLAAIDLMPTNSREEVARLCRQLIDRRPQAVHIWQDIPYAAVACALVGVPHFFVHRGSLAPDYWTQSDYQTATHFRPMRHIYRRLLERPDFVLLNNSVSGCQTDQAWVGWPDSAPFQVVYNAVDFTQLGEHVGRNVELRRELGIPDDAPVIGGSFRIVEVKRPRFWIEAARQIRIAIPNAHFLIIGDGDMTEEVAAFAAEHGFGEAVHLPGRVANVGEWYRAMDLKLMTSEREGIPNAIIEAQHFGVPIVATHVGGIHEAIDPGRTGFVTPGDQGPDPYAAQVIAALRDTSWHEAARQRAPRFVHEKFSLDTVVERLMAFYGMRTARRSPDAPQVAADRGSARA